MNVIVNGKACDVSARTLADLMEELNFTSPFVATALNAEFIARELRADMWLADGDQVEILAPMKGG
ncbi:sulfur carrier protein ThiS [Aliiroseovarius crassostreae]|uniref:Sulfur carrier protein ThiS n=1 Tax=Aliiroseovarius crassostreae TaxID=154981 RepID=A0A9Q9LTP7_9RHOB|nr:sulfur carrier protein ThiS [Aliiroseovarius crassostreae]UWP89184.1 sulfur carrier protein ThiS [Aliiroseovarius crassostreae]UWP92315.1 sulfur carrier protein ThiS [Aliiroseovarius crassostreae]UWP95460.1 sulfur carrier protein ThiS [Aliiroseovarius crassostreae]UWP98620.1 sulfur carrier protein ThiS [Aliiroseovarius crassostreae]UWQ01828.1 sulfur carrier protein ThiS [Aliiroseovarius crassostreae]